MYLTVNNKAIANFSFLIFHYDINIQENFSYLLFQIFNAVIHSIIAIT